MKSPLITIKSPVNPHQITIKSYSITISCSKNNFCFFVDGGCNLITMIFARASPPQIFAPGLQKGSILIGKIHYGKTRNTYWKWLLYAIKNIGIEPTNH